MPFIVQCPHADCRRYMLLEDDARGSTVNCLLCAKPVRVDASASGSHNAAINKPGGSAAPPPKSPPPQVAPPKSPPQPASGDDKVIVNCPNPMCKSPLKVAAASRGTNLRCPKCKQVFKA